MQQLDQVQHEEVTDEFAVPPPRAPRKKLQGRPHATAPEDLDTLLMLGGHDVTVGAAASELPIEAHGGLAHVNPTAPPLSLPVTRDILLSGYRKGDVAEFRDDFTKMYLHKVRGISHLSRCSCFHILISAMNPALPYLSSHVTHPYYLCPTRSRPNTFPFYMQHRQLYDVDVRMTAKIRRAYP